MVLLGDVKEVIHRTVCLCKSDIHSFLAYVIFHNTTMVSLFYLCKLCYNIKIYYQGLKCHRSLLLLRFALLQQPIPPPTFFFTTAYTHTQQDYSEQVFSCSQWVLPTHHTTDTRDEHSCCQWDLNPRSQQLSSFRPMPWTADPPGLAQKSK